LEELKNRPTEYTGNRNNQEKKLTKSMENLENLLIILEAPDSNRPRREVLNRVNNSTIITTGEKRTSIRNDLEDEDFGKTIAVIWMILI
jgi:hypothetical protein